MQLKNNYFTYLDILRESGVTNMFGAGPYLQKQFGMNRYEAKDIILEWIETYPVRQGVKNAVG